MRYTLHIYFTHIYNGLRHVPPMPIIQDFKTRIEVDEYKILIDDTVEKAYVVDNANGNVETWK